MRRGPVRAAILFSTLVGACNALSGVGDLGVCPADGTCAAIADEAGTLEATSPEGSPGIDGARVDADAGPDGTAPFGTGRSGPLKLGNGTSIVVNAYAAITGAAKTGDTAVLVGDATMFGAGDLVLVWQAAGLAGVVSGNQAPLVLAPSSVGHFEMARVASKTATQVFLTAPLAFSYPVAGSQVVGLPEYTDVTIPTGSKVSGLAWDGARGGIVAFLATGTVTVAGEINVDGLGFRGGVGYQGKGGGGCMSFDGVPEVGYAAKGEGIALGGYTTANDGGGIGGRGNLANGAGGGVCHNGGGAGGGHGGAGGPGGIGVGLGGLAGVVLQYPALHALLMGGGGAAGDDNNGAPLPSGGSGGGVIFVRARSIRGGGTIAARGAPGLVAPGNDGSGGGGAGGGIVIVAETSLEAITLRAEGGPGGSATGAGGGGGGGGVVDVSTSSFQSSAVVTGGDAGGTGSFVAGTGAMGRIDVGDGG